MWLGECSREVETEEVSNSRNKICQTTYKDIFQALYASVCSYHHINQPTYEPILPQAAGIARGRYQRLMTLLFH